MKEDELKIINQISDSQNLLQNKDIYETEKKLDNQDQIQKADFDDVLNKLQFGLYQLRIYLAMAILNFSEGAQIQIYTLTLQIQKKEYNIENNIQNFQSSLVFLSFLIGSFFTGEISGRYGRAKPCIIGSFFLMLFQILISQAQNLYQLIFFRTVSSFLIGFFAPLACTILTELTPSKNRGKLMAILSVSFSLGQLFSVFLSQICLSPDLESGDWRLLILLSTLPLIFSFLLQILYLDESPRYELIKGDTNLGLNVMDKICLVNQKKSLDLLYLGVREDLIRWSLKQKDKSEEKTQISQLLNQIYKKITLILWFNWISLSFSLFGIILYLPTQLKKLQKLNEQSVNMQQLMYSQIIEILGLFLGAMIIDSKSLGRKNSMIILYAMCSICCLFTYLRKDNLIFYVTLSKILLNNILNFLFQFTSEVYPTQIRTSGIGISNGIGKSTGIFIPYVCGYLEAFDNCASYLAFSILCFVSSFISSKLPFDTAGQPLDTKIFYSNNY